MSMTKNTILPLIHDESLPLSIFGTYQTEGFINHVRISLNLNIFLVEKFNKSLNQHEWILRE